LNEAGLSGPESSMLKAGENAFCPLVPLCQVTRNFSEALDLDSVLEMLLVELGRVVAYDSAGIFLIDRERLRLRAWRGPQPLEALQAFVFPLQGNALVHDVFKSVRPLVLDDVAVHPGWIVRPDFPEVHSWIGAPLRAGGEIVGLLTVDKFQPGVYGDPEAGFVSSFADYAAVAVRNAMMATRTRESLSRRSFLYEAARVLNTSLDLDEILQTLLNLTHEQFHPDAISVALVQPDGSLFFSVASGSSADQVRGLSLPPDTGIVGWVASHGKALWVPDVRLDSRYHGIVDKQTGFETRAIYAVPVKTGTMTIAILEVLNPPLDIAMEDAGELLEALAVLAASAIQNARLFEQVRQAEERYQRLFDLNLDPIVILDEDGVLLDLNRAARQLLGISRLAVGNSCLAALDLTVDRFNEYKLALDATEAVTWETRIERTGNRPRVLEVYLSRFPSVPLDGAYQWIAHDVTDRVALEEMRTQLSHMIVHDLRNPLGGILTSLEVTLMALTEQDRASGELYEMLQIANRSAQRMDRLIGTILDTAHLRSGERLLSVGLIAVPEVLSEVAEMLMPALRSRNQTLSIVPMTDLPMLPADGELLRRVLVNLLDNAIKFSGRHKEIIVKVEMHPSEMWFSVIDFGQGIPPEDQGRIFGLFVRGQEESARRVRGSGVGLAFCKLAVEAHGGRIWVESIAGEGSTFIFTIPLTPVE